MFVFGNIMIFFFPNGKLSKLSCFVRFDVPLLIEVLERRSNALCAVCMRSQSIFSLLYLVHTKCTNDFDLKFCFVCPSCQILTANSFSDCDPRWNLKVVDRYAWAHFQWCGRFRIGKNHILNECAATMTSQSRAKNGYFTCLFFCLTCITLDDFYRERGAELFFFFFSCCTRNVRRK